MPRPLRLLHTIAAAVIVGAAALAATPAALAQAGSGTHAVRVLTPETAMKAVHAALQDCRKRGYQVSVAVVDRFGIEQATWRDRFAGAHTPDFALDKAWTAVSFRTPTSELARATQPGQPSSGIRHVPRFAAVGGGLLIEGGGSIVGGIGVSGAPSGDADDECGKAGIAEIKDELDF